MENFIEKNSDKKIKKRGNQKGKKYTKALERRKEGLALANQISEEREKYRNSFINYNVKGYHKFKMYIPKLSTGTENFYSNIKNFKFYQIKENKLFT